MEEENERIKGKIIRANIIKRKKKYLKGIRIMCTWYSSLHVAILRF